MSPDIKQTIDARGLSCPLPLLKAKQGLSRLRAGEQLRLVATDPGSQRDLRAFAALSMHQLVSESEEAGIYTYVLQKGE